MCFYLECPTWKMQSCLMNQDSSRARVNCLVCTFERTLVSICRVSTISRFVHDKKITHEIVRDKNRARFFWSKVIFDILFLIKMPIFVDESVEKGSKRRIDVKLVNKGQNYDPFYPILQQLSSTIFWLRTKSCEKAR